MTDNKEEIKVHEEYLLDGSKTVRVREIENGKAEVELDVYKRRLVELSRLTAINKQESKSFFCHEREIPTCETQCIDCEVWNALVDEKCDPTPEQKEKTFKIVLKAYEQLKNSLTAANERIEELEWELKTQINDPEE
jgi:hypothetical protein